MRNASPRIVAAEMRDTSVEKSACDADFFDVVSNVVQLFSDR